MDETTRSRAAGVSLQRPPQPANTGHDPGRVALTLGRWQKCEVELALSFRECSGLSTEQVEDLYQETALALLRRPFNDEAHMQRALHQGLRTRALNLHRDERRREEIITEHAHALQAESRAQDEPEQSLLEKQDQLLIEELVAELDETHSRTFALMMNEGVGHHRVARALGISANQARSATRACERKAREFLALYECGRLCGYRAETIKALQAGKAPDAQLVRAALAHLQACPRCRIEHQTNASALQRAFNEGAAAALAPLPALIIAHAGWLERLALHARLLQHRLLTHGVPLGSGGARERAGALPAGGGASVKVAAGLLTAAVLAGGTLAAHDLTKPTHTHAHRIAREHSQAVIATRPVRMSVAAFTPAWPARRTHRSRTQAIPRSHTEHRARQYEPGGFAYLGVPASPPKPPPTEIRRRGGPFGP
jgi:RNA polymerase sigma factor (sigma-70 family)